MRDKEFLKRQIAHCKKHLASIPNKRLGFRLYYLQSYDGNFTRDKPLIVDCFEYHAHKHDTGVSVTVNIVNGGEKLAIINGTYWYSESTYGFNKFTRLRGAWDAAFEKANKKITDMCITKQEAEIEQLNSELKIVIDNEKAKIDSFSEMFANSDS